MKNLSLFSGVGGLDLAADWAGFQTVGFCEKEPFCHKILSQHWKGVPIFDDVSALTASELERSGIDSRDLDLISGGFPCFTAETMVLTQDGYKIIPDIDIGDMVLTHRARWRKVTSVMSRESADIIAVNTFGSPIIHTTAEHPFFARINTSFKEKVDGKWKRRHTFSEPKWVDAKNLDKECFLCQIVPPILSQSPATVFVKESGAFYDVGAVWDDVKRAPDNCIDQSSEDFWWLVGRYLADGWLVDRKGRKNGRVIICCALQEADELARRISVAGFAASRCVEKTIVKFHITKGCLYEFLKPFGRYAYGKRLSGAALSLNRDMSRALLVGYASGDGCTIDSDFRNHMVTASKELALGLSLIIQKVHGVVASIHIFDPPNTAVIEGRIVNQRRQWHVRFRKKNLQAFVDDSFGWKPVIRSEPAGVATVFNISVDEDESYVADGCVVHNCQNISAYGKGEGITGDRSGLWFQMLRLIEECRPSWVLAENVPYLRSRGYDEVATGLEEAGYSVRQGVVGAWTAGSPHRRNRVFIVARQNDDGRFGRGCGAFDEGMADAAGVEVHLRGPRLLDEEALGGEGFDASACARDRSGRDGNDGTACSEGAAPDESRLGRGSDELSARLDSSRNVARRGERQFEWEPPRLLPEGGTREWRTERLKALGNAVDPAQAYPVFAYIASEIRANQTFIK